MQHGFSQRHAGLLRSLPYAHGTIRKVTPGREASSKIVIHIQDVHMNHEAQTHIGQAVGSLVEGKQVGVVGLEGAFAPIDLENYRTFPDRAVVRAAADWLFKEQKISGPVHAAITGPIDPPPFVGIDHAGHYEGNVEAYRRSIPLTSGYKTRWSEARGESDERKAAVFSPALKDFDAQVEAYRRNEMGLGEYVALLGRHAPPPAQAKAFLGALQKEKALDFREVERERTRLVEALVNRLTSAQLKALLEQSVAYRLGEIRHTDYYRSLRGLCAASGVSLESFPSMAGYIQYVLLSDGIDASVLFLDIQRMERDAYAGLVRTPEEKRVAGEAKTLYLAGKLLDFSLTPDEWADYRDSSLSSSPLGSEWPLDVFEAFYREAQARDEAMAQNLLDAMDTKKSDAAVLVTGGFHGPGIERFLSQAGASVVTFVPKLTMVETDKGSAYLGVFTQEKTPLEKLFQGEKLFTAPHPANDSQGPALIGAMSAITQQRPEALQETLDGWKKEEARQEAEVISLERRRIQAALKSVRDVRGSRLGRVILDVRAANDNASIESVEQRAEMDVLGRWAAGAELYTPVAVRAVEAGAAGALAAPALGTGSTLSIVNRALGVPVARAAVEIAISPSNRTSSSASFAGRKALGSRFWTGVIAGALFISGCSPALSASGDAKVPASTLSWTGAGVSDEEQAKEGFHPAKITAQYDDTPYWRGLKTHAAIRKRINWLLDLDYSRPVRLEDYRGDSVEAEDRFDTARMDRFFDRLKKNPGVTLHAARTAVQGAVLRAASSGKTPGLSEWLAASDILFKVKDTGLSRTYRSVSPQAARDFLDSLGEEGEAGRRGAILLMSAFVKETFWKKGVNASELPHEWDALPEPSLASLLIAKEFLSLAPEGLSGGDLLALLSSASLMMDEESQSLSSQKSVEAAAGMKVLSRAVEKQKRKVVPGPLLDGQKPADKGWGDARDGILYLEAAGLQAPGAADEWERTPRPLRDALYKFFLFPELSLHYDPQRARELAYKRLFSAFEAGAFVDNSEVNFLQRLEGKVDREAPPPTALRSVTPAQSARVVGAVEALPGNLREEVYYLMRTFLSWKNPMDSFPQGSVSGRNDLVRRFMEHAAPDSLRKGLFRDILKDATKTFQTRRYVLPYLLLERFLEQGLSQAAIDVPPSVLDQVLREGIAWPGRLSKNDLNGLLGHDDLTVAFTAALALGEVTGRFPDAFAQRWASARGPIPQDRRGDAALYILEELTQAHGNGELILRPVFVQNLLDTFIHRGNFPLYARVFTELADAGLSIEVDRKAAAHLFGWQYLQVQNHPAVRRFFQRLEETPELYDRDIPKMPLAHLVEMSRKGSIYEASSRLAQLSVNVEQFARDVPSIPIQNVVEGILASELAKRVRADMALRNETPPQDMASLKYPLIHWLQGRGALLKSLTERQALDLAAGTLRHIDRQSALKAPQVGILGPERDVILLTADDTRLFKPDAIIEVADYFGSSIRADIRGKSGPDSQAVKDAFLSSVEKAAGESQRPVTVWAAAHGSESHLFLTSASLPDDSAMTSDPATVNAHEYAESLVKGYLGAHRGAKTIDLRHMTIFLYACYMPPYIDKMIRRLEELGKEKGLPVILPEFAGVGQSDLVATNIPFEYIKVLTSTAVEAKYQDLLKQVGFEKGKPLTGAHLIWLGRFLVSKGHPGISIRVREDAPDAVRRELKLPKNIPIDPLLELGAAEPSSPPAGRFGMIPAFTRALAPFFVSRFGARKGLAIYAQAGAVGAEGAAFVGLAAAAAGVLSIFSGWDPVFAAASFAGTYALSKILFYLGHPKDMRGPPLALMAFLPVLVAPFLIHSAGFTPLGVALVLLVDMVPHFIGNVRAFRRLSQEERESLVRRILDESVEQRAEMDVLGRWAAGAELCTPAAVRVVEAGAAGVLVVPVVLPTMGAASAVNHGAGKPVARAAGRFHPRSLGRAVDSPGLGRARMAVAVLGLAAAACGASLPADLAGPIRDTAAEQQDKVRKALASGGTVETALALHKIWIDHKKILTAEEVISLFDRNYPPEKDESGSLRDRRYVEGFLWYIVERDKIPIPRRMLERMALRKIDDGSGSLALDYVNELALPVWPGLADLFKAHSYELKGMPGYYYVRSLKEHNHELRGIKLIHNNAGGETPLVKKAVELDRLHRAQPGSPDFLHDLAVLQKRFVAYGEAVPLAVVEAIVREWGKLHPDDLGSLFFLDFNLEDADSIRLTLKDVVDLMKKARAEGKPLEPYRLNEELTAAAEMEARTAPGAQTLEQRTARGVRGHRALSMGRRRGSPLDPSSLESFLMSEDPSLALHAGMIYRDKRMKVPERFFNRWLAGIDQKTARSLRGDGSFSPEMEIFFLRMINDSVRGGMLRVPKSFLEGLLNRPNRHGDKIWLTLTLFARQRMFVTMVDSLDWGEALFEGQYFGSQAHMELLEALADNPESHIRDFGKKSVHDLIVERSSGGDDISSLVRMYQFGKLKAVVAAGTWHVMVEDFFEAFYASALVRRLADAGFKWRGSSVDAGTLRAIRIPLLHVLESYRNILGSMSPEKQVEWMKKAAAFILDERLKATEGSLPILGSGRRVILLSNAEARFSVDRKREMVRYFGADLAPEDVFKGSSDEKANEKVKTGYLRRLAEMAADPTAEDLVWNDGHGDPAQYWLSPATPVGYKEIIEALVDGQKGAKVVDLTKKVLVFDACFMHDMVDKILREEMARLEKERGITILPPLIIVTSGRGRLGWDTFGRAIESVTQLTPKVAVQAKRYARVNKGEPFRLQHLFSIDSYLNDNFHGDPGVFIHIDPDKVRKALEIPDKQKVPRYLEIGFQVTPSSPASRWAGVTLDPRSWTGLPGSLLYLIAKAFGAREKTARRIGLPGFGLEKIAFVGGAFAMAQNWNVPLIGEALGQVLFWAAPVMLALHVAFLIRLYHAPPAGEEPMTRRQFLQTLLSYALIFGGYFVIPDFLWLTPLVSALHIYQDRGLFKRDMNDGAAEQRAEKGVIGRLTGGADLYTPMAVRAVEGGASGVLAAPVILPMMGAASMANHALGRPVIRAALTLASMGIRSDLMGMSSQLLRRRPGVLTVGVLLFLMGCGGVSAHAPLQAPVTYFNVEPAKDLPISLTDREIERLLEAGDPVPADDLVGFAMRREVNLFWFQKVIGASLTLAPEEGSKVLNALAHSVDRKAALEVLKILKSKDVPNAGVLLKDLNGRFKDETEVRWAVLGVLKARPLANTLDVLMSLEDPFGRDSLHVMEVIESHSLPITIEIMEQLLRKYSKDPYFVFKSIDFLIRIGSRTRGWPSSETRAVMSGVLSEVLANEYVDGIVLYREKAVEIFMAYPEFVIQNIDGKGLGDLVSESVKLDKEHLNWGVEEAYGAEIVRRLVGDYSRRGKQVPQGLADISMPLLHFLQEYSDFLPPSEEDRIAFCERVAQAILDERSRVISEGMAILGPGRKLVAAFNADSDHFKPQEMKNIFLHYGIAMDERYVGSEEAVKNKKVKRGYLRMLQRISEGMKPTTVWNWGHGGPGHFWFANGEVGEEISNNLQNPMAVSYREIAEKLVQGQSGRPEIDLGHLLLIFDDCFGYDMAITTLQNDILRLAGRKTVKSMPVIITLAHRGRVGIDGLNVNLEEAMKKDIELSRPHDAFLLKDLLAVEKHYRPDSNMAVSVPIDFASIATKVGLPARAPWKYFMEISSAGTGAPKSGPLRVFGVIPASLLYLIAKVIFRTREKTARRFGLPGLGVEQLLFVGGALVLARGWSVPFIGDALGQVLFWVAPIMLITHVALLIRLYHAPPVGEEPMTRRQFLTSLLSYILIFGGYFILPDFLWLAPFISAFHIYQDRELFKRAMDDTVVEQRAEKGVIGQLAAGAKLSAPVLVQTARVVASVAMAAPVLLTGGALSVANETARRSTGGKAVRLKDGVTLFGGALLLAGCAGFLAPPGQVPSKAKTEERAVSPRQAVIDSFEKIVDQTFKEAAGAALISYAEGVGLEEAKRQYRKGGISPALLDKAVAKYDEEGYRDFVEGQVERIIVRSREDMDGFIKQSTALHGWRSRLRSLKGLQPLSIPDVQDKQAADPIDLEPTLANLLMSAAPETQNQVVGAIEAYLGLSPLDPKAGGGSAAPGEALLRSRLERLYETYDRDRWTPLFDGFYGSLWKSCEEGKPLRPWETSYARAVLNLQSAMVFAFLPPAEKFATSVGRLDRGTRALIASLVAGHARGRDPEEILQLFGVMTLDESAFRVFTVDVVHDYLDKFSREGLQRTVDRIKDSISRLPPAQGLLVAPYVQKLDEILPDLMDMSDHFQKKVREETPEPPPTQPGPGPGRPGKSDQLGALPKPGQGPSAPGAFAVNGWPESRPSGLLSQLPQWKNVALTGAALAVRTTESSSEEELGRTLAEAEDALSKGVRPIDLEELRGEVARLMGDLLGPVETWTDQIEPPLQPNPAQGRFLKAYGDFRAKLLGAAPADPDLRAGLLDRVLRRTQSAGDLLEALDAQFATKDAVVVVLDAFREKHLETIVTAAQEKSAATGKPVIWAAETGALKARAEAILGAGTDVPLLEDGVDFRHGGGAAVLGQAGLEARTRSQWQGRPLGSLGIFLGEEWSFVRNGTTPLFQKAEVLLIDDLLHVEKLVEDAHRWALLIARMA